MFRFLKRKKNDKKAIVTHVKIVHTPVQEYEKHTQTIMFEGKMLIEIGRDWGFRPKYNRNILLMLIDEEMFLSLIRNINGISTEIAADEGFETLVLNNRGRKPHHPTEESARGYEDALYAADRTDRRGIAEERLVSDIEDMLATYKVLTPEIDFEVHHHFKSVSAAYRRECTCPCQNFHLQLSRKKNMSVSSLGLSQISLSTEDNNLTSMNMIRQPIPVSERSTMGVVSRFTTDGSRKVDRNNPIVPTGYGRIFHMKLATSWSTAFSEHQQSNRHTRTTKMILPAFRETPGWQTPIHSQSPAESRRSYYKQ
eukprot:CFRG0977T1